MSLLCSPEVASFSEWQHPEGVPLLFQREMHVACFCRCDHGEVVSLGSLLEMPVAFFCGWGLGEVVSLRLAQLIISRVI